MIRHVGLLIASLVIDARQRPSSSRSCIPRNMNGTSESVPAPKFEGDSMTAAAAEGDSDDEVFHDARFPVEEEAVS